MVAKNLAHGSGYSSTVQIGPGVGFRTVPFDIGITTGPLVVLPASFLILLLGNHYWVPGLTIVLIWLVLLLLTRRALAPMLAPPQANFGAAFFFLAVFVVFPYHFEHWYALLGEVPAALCVLLATVVWGPEPFRRSRLAAAGLIFSCAMLSKLLSLVWIGSFLIVFILVHIRRRKWQVRVLAGDFAVIAGAMTAPVILFEVWKVVALGADVYAANLRQYLAYVAWGGVSRDPVGLWTRVSENSQGLYQRFSLSTGELLLLGTFGIAALFRQASSPLKRVAGVLYVGLWAHLLWWLFLSDGRPRYAIIAIILALALVSVSVASMTRLSHIAFCFLALAVISVPNWSRLRLGVGPGERPSRASAVLGFLEHQPPGTVVVTEWATGAAFQYQSRSPLTLKPASERRSIALESEYFVLQDERFLKLADRDLGAIGEECGVALLDFPPYRLFRCNASAPRVLPGAESRSRMGELRRSATATRARYTLERVGEVRNAWHRKEFEVRAGRTLFIAGWALDGAGKAGGVEVTVGGVPHVARYGLQRADVAAQLGCADCRDSGFELDLPPSTLGRGSHTMTIRVITSRRTRREIRSSSP